MVAQVTTFAFHGVEARTVQAQVQLTGGANGFFIVGLPDKAVSEARERVRAALSAVGLGLPPKRITVNLAPADMPKEGSHFDLPIAVALLMEIGAMPRDAVNGYAIMGELGLDGSITAVNGALPAAVAANTNDLGLICPAASGAEAAWAGGSADILAPKSLIQLVNHFKGTQVLSAPEPGGLAPTPVPPDMVDVRGQETAKRVLEIAAVGGHNLLLVGPPGAGKSMLAARLPGLLSPLSPAEMLEVSMVQSMAGLLDSGQLTRARPFRAPHHSASMAAMVGGGIKAKPGEASLAHHGVLFLDELPEFSGIMGQTHQIWLSITNPRITPAVPISVAIRRCGAFSRPIKKACQVQYWHAKESKQESEQYHCAHYPVLHLGNAAKFMSIASIH